jgi:hypothetical protein
MILSSKLIAHNILLRFSFWRIQMNSSGGPLENRCIPLNLDEILELDLATN